MELATTHLGLQLDGQIYPIALGRMMHTSARAMQDHDEEASIQTMSRVVPIKETKQMPYAATMTPKMSELEGGALRKGGAPNLYAFQNIGLLANYAAVGIIYGAFKRIVYPFLNNYLNMDGYQAMAAKTLISMPWAFKTFIGIITDSFPICGYRRRPYMIFGWTICFVFLLIMAILPVDDPYYAPSASLQSLSPSELQRVYAVHSTVLNKDAPYAGSKYILLMIFAALGYVLADVSADGILVEYAQREPEDVRGSIQTTCYFVYFVFQIFSAAITGFLMNGEEYGGQFSFSLPFNQIMAIFSIVAALVIPTSIWCLQEDKVERESFSNRCAEMWRIVQNRAVWQIIAYKFFGGLFQYFQAAPASIIQREWAGVQPLNESISTIVGLVAISLALFCTKTYGLGWDWRRTIAVTTIVTVVIDACVSFVTIFDLFRNQWFWLGVPILEEAPRGISLTIGTMVVVEITEIGYEGATYGLVKTIQHLSCRFASSISKNVDAYFDAYLDDIKRDDQEARWQVAYTFIIMYVMKLLSVFWLILLPRQKKEAQELKRTGGSSKIAGLLSLSIAIFALTWSIVTNLLSLFPETSCYRIAGGEGCKH